jgi:hypothetical protein
MKDPRHPREQALAFTVAIAAAGQASAALVKFPIWELDFRCSAGAGIPVCQASDMLAIASAPTLKIAA